jgi:hypothetical protein
MFKLLIINEMPATIQQSGKARRKGTIIKAAEQVKPEV